MLIVNFSSVMILSFNLIALPLINLLISLLELSNLDKTINQFMEFYPLSISFALTFIDGKFELSKFVKNLFSSLL